MTSCASCTSNIFVNDDHTATLSTNLCSVSYKTLQTYFDDPSDWINTILHDCIEVRAEQIYRKQLDKIILAGTLPTDITKRSIILSYVKDSDEYLEP